MLGIDLQLASFEMLVKKGGEECYSTINTFNGANAVFEKSNTILDFAKSVIALSNGVGVYL